MVKIPDKILKKLWGKSGGLCAICKTDLFKDGSNIGEVCHIISKKTEGPRHKDNIRDYDSYDNLIVLCSNCHKIIDTQTEKYPEEKLREIKRKHEDERNKDRNKCLYLFRKESGVELGMQIWGCHSHKILYNYIDKENLKIICELSDYINQIMNLQDIIVDKKRVYDDLNSYIISLYRSKFRLFSTTTTYNIKGMEFPCLLILVANNNSEIIRTEITV